MDPNQKDRRKPVVAVSSIERPASRAPRHRDLKALGLLVLLAALVLVVVLSL